MSKKQRKSRGPGGWPRSGGPAPIIPERKPKLPKLPMLPREAKGFHMLAAMQRSMAEMQAGGPSEQDFSRRFERLQCLFSTHQDLSAIRPDLRKLDAAFVEFDKANPDLVARADQAAREGALAYVFGKVFDKNLTERLEEAMTEALLEAESSADADALVTGLLCIQQAKKGAPAGENPLFQMLAHMAEKEEAHMEDALRGLGIPTDPAELQRLLTDPAEIERLSSDPETLRKVGEMIEKDPVARQQGRRLAEETEEELCDKIAAGEIEAHLTAEELAPFLAGLGKLGKRFGLGTDRGISADHFRNEAARLLQRFADDPANRPAFERFAKELKAQGGRAAITSDSKALKTRALANIWAGAWKDDTYFRMRVAHASVSRLRDELAADEDEPEQQDVGGPPPSEPTGPQE